MTIILASSLLQLNKSIVTSPGSAKFHAMAAIVQLMSSSGQCTAQSHAVIVSFCHAAILHSPYISPLGLEGKVLREVVLNRGNDGLDKLEKDDEILMYP